jgi:capsular exopolysaccharide synthesis family protein
MTPAQFDLAAFLEALRRRKWLILAVTIGAALLAFGLSQLQSKSYEASAELLFGPTEPPPSVDPSEPPPDIADAPERVAATNLALASRDTVATRVKRRLRSPLPVDELRDKVSLEPKGQADIVVVNGSADTAGAAARLTNVFAGEIVALRRRAAQARIQRVIDALRQQLAGAPPGSSLAGQLQRRAGQLEVEKRLEGGDVEVSQPATPPLDPTAPKPLRNAFIGAGLGLLLGLLLAVLLDRLDRRVRDEQEAAETIAAPVLARVPLAGKSELDRQLFLESFQFLRANVQLRDPKHRHRLIAVTSALPGQGKSTVAAELATALALSGAEVLLVDCDLRRPSLHEHFMVDGRRGVTDIVVGGARATDLLQPTKLPHLRLLAAGPQVPIPAAMLAGGEGIPTLLAELQREAEYVIIDTSPVAIGADASAVAAEVDGVLMVIDLDHADREALEMSRDQLAGAGATVIGVVFNRAEVLLPDSEYKGYYAAGQAAGHPGRAPGGGRWWRRRRQRVNGGGPYTNVASLAGDSKDDPAPADRFGPRTGQNVRSDGPGAAEEDERSPNP